MFFYIHAVACIRHKRESDQNLLALAWIFPQADFIEKKSGVNREQMVPLQQSHWWHDIKPRFLQGTNSSFKNASMWLVWKLTRKQMLLWYIMQEVAVALELKNSVLLKPGIWFNAKTNKVLGKATWITLHSCFAFFNYLFWNQINNGCFWVGTALDENKKACHVITQGKEAWSLFLITSFIYS